MDADLIVIGAGQAGLAVDLVADIRLGHRILSVVRETDGFRVHSEDGSELRSRGLNAAQPVVDDGAYRAAIVAGRPDHRPLFDRLDGREAVWAGGEREPIDALILATGYRPDLPYLAGTGALDRDGLPIHRLGASATVPGLGFVRLELQRGISSATIRGVARDADRVVGRLPFAGAPTPRRACCGRAAYA